MLHKLCMLYLYIYNFSSFNFRLDDNAWHSVLVEKNRKESMVVIDGARKGQSKEGRGPVRPMLLTSGLFIGANQDSSDGFVGCMRALVLNGVNIDLQVLFFFVKSQCSILDSMIFTNFLSFIRARLSRRTSTARPMGSTGWASGVPENATQLIPV